MRKVSTPFFSSSSLLVGAAGAMCLAAFLPSTGWAHTISGVVREAGTRRVIPDATVVVGINDEIEIYTDETGTFSIDVGDLKSKEQQFSLLVIASGFQRQNLIVTAKDGELTSIDFYMLPAADEQATTVRERRARDNIARGSHRIEDREVNELAGTYGDPAKAIENFPGMGRVLRSQGSLLVRGASPGETGVYVDDYEIPDLYHFTGSTSVINLPFVDSVELVPGAFSARYGRATGGLVSLRTKKLPNDDVHGFAKFDVIDGGAYIGVPISEKLTVGISARRSWLDVLRESQIALAGTGDSVVNIPTYWDYQLKVDYDPRPGHEASLFWFGSGDRDHNVRNGEDGLTDYVRNNDSDFHRLSLRLQTPVAEGLTNIFTPVVGYERNTFDELGGLRFRDRQTYDVQVRDELTYRYETSRIIFGIDATMRTDRFVYGGLFADTGERSIPSPDLDGRVRSQRREASADRLTTAFYAEGTFEPAEHFTIVPGVRIEGLWYDESPRFIVEPRFALQYDVLTGEYGTTLRASTGLFSRPPDPDEVAAMRDYGKELDVQNALHMQAGLEQRFGPGASMTANFFAIWRDDTTTRARNFPVPNDAFENPVIAGGSGNSVGGEFLLRSSFSKKYFAWASYAIARHDRIDGFSDDATPYAYASPFDTTHLLTLVGQMQLPAGFRVGARYRIATGMPLTPVLGGILDADSGIYQPIEGPIASQRFPVFHVLDVRVDWATVLPWCEIDVYADLVNVLNLRAEEGQVFNYNFSDYTPLLGLPIIPAVGVKTTF